MKRHDRGCVELVTVVAGWKNSDVKSWRLKSSRFGLAVAFKVTADAPEYAS